MQNSSTPLSDWLRRSGPTDPGREEKLAILLGEVRRRKTESRWEFYSPHPIQEKFHREPSRRRALIGANQVGKTTAGAMEAIWTALGTHPYRPTANPPVTILVASESTDVQMEAAQAKILEYLPPAAIAGRYKRLHEALSELSLVNGSRFLFRTYEMEREKFQGFTLTGGAWLDEEPADEQLFAEIERGLLRHEVPIWMTFTPLRGLSWSYDRVWNSADWACTTAGVRDNPTIPAAMIEQWERSLPEDERQARIYGRYVARSGLVFPEFGRKTHVLDEFAPSPTDEIVVGLDTGRVMAAIWLAFPRHGSIVAFDEVYEQDIRMDDFADMIHARNGQWKVQPRYFLDATSPFRLELSSRAIDAMLYDQVKSEGIDLMRQLLFVQPGPISPNRGNPGLFLTERTAKLMFEIERYRWETYESRKLRNVLRPTPRKGFDHAIDALRYGLAWKQYEVAPDPTALPPSPPTTHSEFLRALKAHNREGRPDPSNDDPFLGSEW